MKAQERCSCGGTFEAEGRGALAALRDWRAAHQHGFTFTQPYVWPLPTTQPNPAIWPWAITSSGTTPVSSPNVTYADAYRAKRDGA